MLDYYRSESDRRELRTENGDPRPKRLKLDDGSERIEMPYKFTRMDRSVDTQHTNSLKLTSIHKIFPLPFQLCEVQVHTDGQVSGFENVSLSSQRTVITRVFVSPVQMTHPFYLRIWFKICSK